MHGNVVLICSGDVAMVRLATAALTCSGNRVRHIERFPSAIDDREPVDAVIVDVDTVPETAALVREIDGRIPIVALVGTEDSRAATRLFTRSGINNIVTRPSTKESVVDDYDELRITVEKLLRGDPFGLEKYVSGFGCEIQASVLRSADQRESELSRIETFLRALLASRHVIHKILTAADEMITNAIYNAPIDAAGRSRYATMDRRARLVLAPPEYVRLRFGVCRGRMGLSVIDNFGTLEIDRLKECLARCSESEDPIEQKQGGAGIGLYMLSRSAQQLIFNVAPGQRTEVIALWELEDGRGGRPRTARHSLHFFRATAATGASTDIARTSGDDVEDAEQTQIRLVNPSPTREPPRGSTSPPLHLDSDPEIPDDFSEDTPTDLN